MSRIKIFISGPYTIVDPVINTRKAALLWHELWEKGYAPFCPHISMLLHIIKPLDYEEWMKYCFEYLRTCDGMILIPGLSEGSDRELQFAIRHHIPIFGSIDDIQQYFQKFPTNWTDNLYDILSTCKHQALYGSNQTFDQAIDKMKVEFFYSDSEPKEQLTRIAAFAITALERLE